MRERLAEGSQVFPKQKSDSTQLNPASVARESGLLGPRGTAIASVIQATKEGLFKVGK